MGGGQQASSESYLGGEKWRPTKIVNRTKLLLYERENTIDNLNRKIIQNNFEYEQHGILYAGCASSTGQNPYSVTVTRARERENATKKDPIFSTLKNEGYWVKLMLKGNKRFTP